MTAMNNANNMKTRMFFACFIFVCALLFFPVPRALPQNNTLSSLEDAFVEVTKKVEPAVVSISTTKVITQRYNSPFDMLPDEFKNLVPHDFYEAPPGEQQYKQRGLGSGVIIEIKDDGGYILTNEHVISGVDEIMVTLPDKRQYPGKIVGSDAASDIAVVKIAPKKGETLPKAALGDSAQLKVGQWAIAIGNPFGYALSLQEEVASQPTVTVGVISALGRSIQIQDKTYEDLIQTDAAINSGNSGGPLVNIRGEVIGINTAILAPTGGSIGIGFAIPVSKAKDIIEQLLTGGKVARGFLGIQPQNLDEKKAKFFGLDTKAVIVADVVPGSPAEKAGLKVGDIVLEINGTAVKKALELVNAIQKIKPGTKAKLTLWRKKKKVMVDVVLAELTAKGTGGTQAKMWRGIIVEDVSDKTKSHYQLNVNEGAVVTHVENDSPAWRAGLYGGDVILEFAGRAVKTAKDFYELTDKIGTKDEAMVYIKRKQGSGYTLVEPE